MAIKETHCYVVECDGCGEPEDRGDFVVHYERPPVRSELADYEWFLADDGLTFCPECYDPVREADRQSPHEIQRLYANQALARLQLHYRERRRKIEKQVEAARSGKQETNREAL